MPLTLISSASEALLCPDVEGRLRSALDACGRATLLVPSFAQALDAQRGLALAGGLSLGVTVTTPSAWARERWEVWGDGRRLVDAPSRDVLCARVVAAEAARPGSLVRDNPGTAALLADLARVGLAQLVAAPSRVPEGVTDAEAAVVGLLPTYAEALAAHGLAEGSWAMSELPGVLEAASAEVPPLVVAGFAQMGRPVRGLLCGLARTCEVTVVLPDGEGAALEAPRALARELRALAARGGVPVAEGRPGGEGPRPRRVGELSRVLAELFAPVEAVTPTGAVRLLLPAGPSAEPELVASQLARLAREGARDVVVAAPDPVAAWDALAPRLAARGLTARAQLGVGVPQLGAGRAFLEFAETVARLEELRGSWPPESPVDGGVRVGLGDMSWWPPRALSDFLLCGVSHVDPARARALDASWRANRLLSPAAVLGQLQSERRTSPEVAAATRELLRGRLGSAAARLLAPYARGDRAGDPLALEATAALGAVLALSRSLKGLGLTADPGREGAVPLAELVRVAKVALGRVSAALRLERAVPGALATVRVMGVPEAARLGAGSADALLLMGQTSEESAVATADDVGSAILEAYGVEARPDAMALARARFCALARVPRRVLALERALFGADGKPTYPSVMLGELVACYGAQADARPSELAACLGAGNVAGRGEASV